LCATNNQRLDITSRIAKELRGTGIKTVEYEVLLTEMKAEAIRLMPELEAFLALESEPATKILRVCAYYRMLDRLEFDDGARALMLAYSTGTNLDHLGAFFGVERPVIQEADTSVSLAIPEVKQDDQEYRRLIQLSLEGHTTAGPRGSYIFWALKARADRRMANYPRPTPPDRHSDHQF
jgi:phage-related baseplate assembly protein